MMLFFLAFSFLYSIETWASLCHIEVAEKIFYIKESKKTNVIKKSDCPDNIRKHFNLFIKSSNGVMRAIDIERIFKERFHLGITITPSRIETHDLEEFTGKVLSLTGNRAINKVTLLSGTAILARGDTRIEMSCSNCQSPGKKQIKVELSNDEKLIDTKWLTAVVSIKVKALVANRPLIFNNKPLSFEDVSLQDVYVVRPEGIFSEIGNIHFYKTNKNVPKGKVLRRSDLSPLRLVSAGEIVDVSYTNNNLFLRAKAKPLTSGRYGERIQLRRGKGYNNIITGKVVDRNKVVVEI